jgi:heme/copper-type cytochrome/quinol oxidase subunit 3
MAEKIYSGKKPYRVRYWIGFTILLGLIFLVGQGNEYRQLINKNITLNSSRFGSAFYTLTGFHGLHVFIGLLILLIVLFMELMGDFKDRKSNVLGTVSIYWHFVDIVWLFVFSVVYILPGLIEKY